MNERIYKIIGFCVNLTSYFSSQYAAKLAINLFSSPQKGRLKEDENEYLNSAIQEDIYHNNISIRTYHWKGSKETILLVHGWESNTYRWKPLIETLTSRNYSVVALDAPAHGNSGGRYFNAILYSQCIRVVANKFKVNTIVGHSVGGTSSIISQHGTLLKSLQNIVSLGAPSDFIDIFKRYETMMGYNQRVSQGIKQYVLKEFNHLPEYFSAANFSKDIKANFLVVHDKKDRVVPYTDGLKFKKAHDKIQFIKTEGFGHRLKNDTVHNYVIDFLNA